ncbi:MAG: sensor histidine kinase, partial [Verrucomicrobia bacterium]|nr:sensor histidine kinase [Verrucomicrobiota bacterium]
YDVFHKTARLEVGETVRVVSQQGNPPDLYLTVSTTARGPNTPGEHGIRLNWIGSLRARVYNNGDEANMAFGDAVASGTEVVLYISRVTDTEYAVGYFAGTYGEGELAGISIPGTAGRDLYIGVEDYNSKSSFDNLQVISLADIPVIDSFTATPPFLHEPGNITLAWSAQNAVETTLNGEVVTGTSAVRMLKEPTRFSLVAMGRSGIAVSRTLYVSPMVDPRFPAEAKSLPVDSGRKRNLWPPKHIRRMEEERTTLLEAISVLPQRQPRPLSSRLGYHSRFEEGVVIDGALPSQIDFKWNGAPWLDSVALAPAFHARGQGAYAFPKRFRIELRDAETSAFETVVDWMDEDFPDPGPYPVFFAAINQRASEVRVTIPQVARESDMAYSALGEIYVLRQRSDGSTGDSMVQWGRRHVEVTATNPFSFPPLWDLDYLHDGLTGLGFPLSDEKVESKDLMIIFEDGECPEEIVLLLDLGDVREIGRIDFWPAAPPAGLAFPSFGFPDNITVALSRDPDFETAKRLDVANRPGNMIGETLASVAAGAYKARYLRVTIKGLGEHQGKRILGLGEILLTEFEEPLSINCKVTAQGIPDADLDQLPRLVDGCSWQRRILSQGEWVKGLAKRRPLDRRLAVVEGELDRARAAWRKTLQRAAVSGSSVVLLGLVLGIVLQRRRQHRILDRLKWRIARDLHDDVGSNLGSISLVAERLEQDVDSDEAREDLMDLTLLAREASASLRDVVWVIDRTTIRLPELIHQLMDRAQRVLTDVELSVETPNDCPDAIVSLTFKRHLIMFFKEVVHNCARHAKATEVRISVSVESQQLCVRVADNGCGFDISAQRDGWGVDSMRKRSEELGGTMAIDSRPGQGTTVELAVPLAALLKNLDDQYKTSN